MSLNYKLNFNSHKIFKTIPIYTLIYSAFMVYLVKNKCDILNPRIEFSRISQ